MAVIDRGAQQKMKAEMKIRIFVLSAAVLLFAGMLGGSFAYWSQMLQAVNEFKPGRYQTKIEEAFTAPKNWQPGAEVNKDVRVANTGTAPVFVKLVLNQSWIRTETVYNAAGQAVAPKKGGRFPLTFEGNSGPASAAQIQWGRDVAVLSGGSGLSPSGLQQVARPEDAQGKWLLMDETPDADGNLTLYYMGVLPGGASTPLSVDGVKLHPDIQSVTLETHTVWDKAAKRWVTTSVENPTSDYQSARYTLGVTMYTVQATEAAAKAMFGASALSEQSVIRYMAGLGIKGRDADVSRDATVREKKLYFTRQEGKLSFTPAAGGEHWFMSHLNMLPGESYEDELKIENASGKAFHLFMQAVPKRQAQLPAALLERIRMTVYDGTKLLYEGTALGKAYSGKNGDLQKVVALGKYGAGASGNLRVVLTLDADLPLEYAGILSQIDWKFMVEEQKPNPKVPRTGAIGDHLTYIGLMFVGLALLSGCLLYFLKARRRADGGS